MKEFCTVEDDVQGELELGLVVAAWAKDCVRPGVGGRHRYLGQVWVFPGKRISLCIER